MNKTLENKDIMKYLIEKRLGVSGLMMNFLEQKGITEDDLKNGNIEKAVKEYEEFQEYNEKLKYSYEMMATLRKRRGLSEFDISEDQSILQMEKDLVLKEYLNWHGLIGWGDTVIQRVEEIYGIKLN